MFAALDQYKFEMMGEGYIRTDILIFVSYVASCLIIPLQISVLTSPVQWKPSRVRLSCVVYFDMPLTEPILACTPLLTSWFNPSPMMHDLAAAFLPHLPVHDTFNSMHFNFSLHQAACVYVRVGGGCPPTHMLGGRRLSFVYYFPSLIYFAKLPVS